MILDGRRLSENERLKLMADDEYAADDFVNATWFQEQLKRATLDTERNAQRSVASVLNEYRARGYQGFTARIDAGALIIDGWDCDEGYLPPYLAEAVA